MDQSLDQSMDQPMGQPEHPENQLKIAPKAPVKYNPKWERLPQFQGWLKKNPETGHAYCTYCNMDINIDKGKGMISRHLERVKHVKSAKLRQRNFLKDDDDNDFPESAVARTPIELITQQRKHTEAQLVAFLAENKLPLRLIDPLVVMLKELPSVGEQVQKTELDTVGAYNLIKHGLSTHLKQTVIDKLTDMMFSLVFEQVSDKDGHKHLALCVCYRDENLHIQVDLLDIYEFVESDIELFNRMRETLTELEEGGVPLNNWVGFLLDTTGALFVTTHQLAVLISKTYPWVISIRSPCHMTDQATLTVCEKLSPELEVFCKIVHTHFSAAPSQLPDSLMTFQEYCQVAAEDSTASQACWLSVEAFVKQVLDLWEPLATYFTDRVKEDALNREWTTALGIFGDPLNKVMLQFVEHVLSIMSTYSKTFQTEELLFFQLEHETTELVRKLALSFMRMESVKAAPDVISLTFSDGDLLPLSQVYIGLDASCALEAHLSNASLTYESQEVVSLLATCQQFYKDIIVEIQSRFDFSHPVFHLAGIINPQNATTMQPPSLSEFFANYDHPNWNKNKIEAEWRAVSNVGLPLDEAILQSPQLFWKRVFSIRSPNGGFKFSNLRQVILFFLSLPVSSIVGVKVSKFLKDINISTRISMIGTDMAEYSKLLVDPSLDGEGSGITRKRRRRGHKKEGKH